MKGVSDCISKGANVVMHCMNALRWMHVILWRTNGWNDELMTIQEPFQRLLWMQDSHDQLAARNTLLESKVVWMIRLWSKEYLTTSFNYMNDMTIPCNVSMIMIAWSKWVLAYTDVTNGWKYLNFINSENASVMVVAMR